MAVVIGLVGYGLYLKLDGNLHVTNVGGLTGRSDFGVQNILILGSQTRDGQGPGFGYDPNTNLSDNLLLVHLNAAHTHATVVSIPRDTMVYEPACKSRFGNCTAPAQQQAIIDGAMNLGGPTCAVATVEHLTGIRMDHFIEFDFNSFRTMVSTLGGVEVCVPQAINDPYSNLHITAGRHLITGNQALAFVRTRHGVGDGSDLGRIELQQEFFSSLIQKVESEGVLGNPVQLYDIANTATQAVTVDPGLGSISKLLSLAETLRHLHTKDVSFVTMPTVVDPASDDRLLPEEPEDDMIWQTLDSNKSSGRPPVLPADRPRRRHRAQRQRHHRAGRPDRGEPAAARLPRRRGRQRPVHAGDHRQLPGPGAGRRCLHPDGRARSGPGQRRGRRFRAGDAHARHGLRRHPAAAAGWQASPPKDRRQHRARRWPAALR